MTKFSKTVMLYVGMLSPSVVSDSVTPWTVAHQAPLSMRFSRQEYWSGLPFLPAGHLPKSGMELASPLSPTLPIDSFLHFVDMLPLHGNFISINMCQGSRFYFLSHLFNFFPLFQEQCNQTGASRVLPQGTGRVLSHMM